METFGGLKVSKPKLLENRFVRFWLWFAISLIFARAVDLCGEATFVSWWVASVSIISGLAAIVAIMEAFEK